jgi:D-alanyl-D-alanine carboxypeptidase (penicillin-binding protein 5/6)
LKTLTALTELGRLDPNRLVRPAPPDLVVDGTRAPLKSSVSYRVRDLFTYLLLSSANDAANVIANIDGGRANTVARMNARARTLQANDTHASTPSGLDAPGETTSAYDLALIARAGLSEPDFARIVSSQRASVTGPTGTPIQIESHNRLLALYRGAIGVKTGYTVHARGTFIAAARRGDQTIIVTLLGATPHYYPEAERLLDWGFSVDGHVHPVGELVAPLRNSSPAQEAGRGGVAVASSPGSMSAPAGVLFPLAGLALLVGGAMLRVATVARRRRRHN